MRDSQPLDAQCFEVDLAVENALAEGVSAPSLQHVHDDGGDGDCDEENCENNNEEDPETGEVATGVWMY